LNFFLQTRETGKREEIGTVEAGEREIITISCKAGTQAADTDSFLFLLFLEEKMLIQIYLNYLYL